MKAGAPFSHGQAGNLTAARGRWSTVLPARPRRHAHYVNGTTSDWEVCTMRSKYTIMKTGFHSKLVSWIASDQQNNEVSTKILFEVALWYSIDLITSHYWYVRTKITNSVYSGTPRKHKAPLFSIWCLYEETNCKTAETIFNSILYS